LQTGFAEKKEFRQTFEPHVPRLIRFVNRIIHAVQTNAKLGGRMVLLVVDDLDKPEVDVVLDLFYKKGPIVTQPQCKIVFTVPIALLYSKEFILVKGNFSESFSLPNVKIKERNGGPTEHWETMSQVVRCRLDPALIDNDALALAVEMSGGLVRELVRIMQGACRKALAAKQNSIASSHVEQAVAAMRTEYNNSLTREEDIEILRRVRDTGELRWKKEEPLLRLLHTLFIYSFPNSPGWYGVNPIVLDLIKPPIKNVPPNTAVTVPE